MPPDALDRDRLLAFCDAIWLEDGLSGNTLAAYRRDLSMFAVWLLSRDATLRSGLDGCQNMRRSMP